MTDSGIRGARLQFGGSPWARAAFLADPERAAALAEEAGRLRVSVSVVGKTPDGPWVVRVGTNQRPLRFAGHALHDIVQFGLERWAAGADDQGIVWRAGSDGLGHGQVAGRPTWTLCKRPALGEQFVHPERSRCTACWRALDRRVVAA